MNAQAQALAKAFRCDPAVCYLLPDPNRRERAMRFAFSCYLRYGERFGKVDVSPSGAAVWLPARYARVSTFGLLRAGFVAAPLVLGLPALGRMVRFGRVIAQLRDRVMSRPHLYLFILGADPAGTGEGSRLLLPGLERADRKGLPCYLETTAPRNLPFYTRHGFRVAAEADVPGGPHLWALLRSAPLKLSK